MLRRWSRPCSAEGQSERHELDRECLWRYSRLMPPQ